MNWAIEEIKDSLDDLAPDLFLKGRTAATKAIHDEIEEFAPRYAATADIGFSDEYPITPEGNPDRTLIVFRDRCGAPPVYRSTWGPFLYDHCWLVYYNNQAPKCFDRTNLPLEGYLSHCELVVEIEFDYSENVPPDKEDAFYWDFAKIILAQAPIKIFIFRARSPEECNKVMKKL